MISKHLQNNLKLLQTLQSLPDLTKKYLIEKADRGLIIAICELCLNLCAGSFECSPFVKRKLKRYKNKLKKLANRRKLSRYLRQEKKLINQYGGGVGFLAYLIPTALNYILSHLSHSSANQE